MCLLRRGKSPMPAKQFSKKWSDRGGRRSGALSRSRAHALGDDPICVCVYVGGGGKHFRPLSPVAFSAAEKLQKRRHAWRLIACARLMFFLLTLGSACALPPSLSCLRRFRAALLYGTYLCELPARSARLHKKSHYADVGERERTVLCTRLLSPLKVSSQIGFDGKKTQLFFCQSSPRKSQ